MSKCYLLFKCLEFNNYNNSNIYTHKDIKKKKEKCLGSQGYDKYLTLGVSFISKFCKDLRVDIQGERRIYFTKVLIRNKYTLYTRKSLARTAIRLNSPKSVMH